MSDHSLPALFDTHVHLDDEQLAVDQVEVIARAQQAGVQQMVAVGTTATSSAATVALAAKYEGVFAAVGIQPNYCAEAGPDDWDQVVQLAEQPGVVALGETGLDRYWDHTPWAQQQDYFDRHLRLSQKMDLPFIVHMRECGDDIVEMLTTARQRGPLRGIMHSFTGDEALAEVCLSLGLHISFAGMVTFRKSDALRAVAATIPADRLLVETDAPYLSPHPKRSVRPNEPALMVHTATCLAETRSISLAQLAELTTNNARELFAV